MPTLSGAQRGKIKTPRFNFGIKNCCTALFMIELNYGTLKKQSLFWDVNLKEIDPNNHKNFIARRILKRDLSDLNWAVGFTVRTC